MRKGPVLVDSDAFVGWMVETDDHHQRVVTIFDKLKRQGVQPVTTNLVIAETASLLSRRVSQSLASQFVAFSLEFPTLFVTQPLHQSAAQLFVAQTNQNTSFVDIANVVVARAHRLHHIFSFDQVYPKKFQLQLVA